MARILVVSADEGRRRLLAALLQESGHAVEPASTDDAALGLVAAGGIEAVVADVVPSRDDAFHLLYAVRDHPATAVAAVPFVITAGRNRSLDRVRGWDAGCDGWVARPHGIGEVLSALDEVLGLSPDDRAARRGQRLDDERAAAERISRG